MPPIWHDRGVSDKGVDALEADSSSAATRRTRADAAADGDPQPVGRALLSRSAESRDWADTGDPDYEPALEGASSETAGPADDGHGQGGSNEGDPAGAGSAGGGSAGAGSAGAGSGGGRSGAGLADDGDGVAGGPLDTDTVLIARPDFDSVQVTAERASARQRLLDQVAALPVAGAVQLDEPEPAEAPSGSVAGDPSDRAPGTAADDAGSSGAVGSSGDAGSSGAVGSSGADGSSGDDDAAEVAPTRRKRPRPVKRTPMLLQGIWPALLAAGLVLASTLGVLPLAAVVLGVQVFLVLGALALLDAPAAGGAFLVATGAVVVGDAVVLLDDGSIDRLGGVAGLGFVAALAHQLARRGRSRVTESLADTLVVLVVAVAAACLIALHQIDGGPAVLQVSFAVAGAVLLVGRIGDQFVPRPVLTGGSTRGWPGLLLGLAAGVVAAGVVAQVVGDPPLRSAVLLGLVIASAVATADLAVDLGAAELRSGWRDARRVAALRPTALLLPYAVVGPVALLAGRLLLT